MMNRRSSASDNIGVRGLPAPYFEIEPPTIQEMAEWVMGGTKNPNVVLSKQQAKDVANKLHLRNLILLKRNETMKDFMVKFVQMTADMLEVFSKIAAVEGNDDVACKQMRDLAAGALLHKLLGEFKQDSATSEEIRHAVQQRAR